MYTCDKGRFLQLGHKVEGTLDHVLFFSKTQENWCDFIQKCRKIMGKSRTKNELEYNKGEKQRNNIVKRGMEKQLLAKKLVKWWGERESKCLLCLLM